MADDLHKLATELVDAFEREHRAAAIGRVYRALQDAYTEGMIAGTRYATQSVNRIFDVIVGQQQ